MPPEAISLRAGRSYSGVTCYGADALASLTADAFAYGSAWAQPPELRALIERHIIVVLAGAIAGELAALGYEEAGYLEEPDTAALLAALEALPSRARELVTEAEAQETSLPDAERAATLAALLTLEPSETDAYLTWLRVSTSHLVSTQWPRIARLAAALLERHVIDGLGAVAILRAANGVSIPPPAGVPAPAQETYIMATDAPWTPADGLAVALMSFVYRASDGQDMTMREDTKVRSNHEAVVRYPHYFALDGLTTAELRAKKAALLNGAIERATSPEPGIVTRVVGTIKGGKK